MLGLKKKREEAKKAEAAGGEKVSVLGIGGKKQATSTGPTTKKRSPGEIRIQKGTSRSVFFVLNGFPVKVSDLWCIMTDLEVFWLCFLICA